MLIEISGSSLELELFREIDSWDDFMNNSNFKIDQISHHVMVA